MASVNKVIIVGNLGADPDVKTFDNGGRIANVSVATSERWTDKQTGEPREITEWHRVVFNDRLADVVAQYLRKGSQIYVEGSLRTRKWTDQQGVERYSTEIRANSMQMLGSRSQNAGDQYNNYPAQNYNNQGYQAQGYQNQQQGYQNQAYNQNPAYNQGYQNQQQGYQNQPAQGFNQNPNFNQNYGQNDQTGIQANMATQNHSPMPNAQTLPQSSQAGNGFGVPNMSHSQAQAGTATAAQRPEQPMSKEVVDDDMPF